MNATPILHAATVAFVLLASAAVARADIVQCTAAGGAISYTDAPCQTHAKTVHASSTSKTAAAAARHRSVTKGFAAAERARVAAWKVKRPVARQMSSDVAQLRTAKATTVSMDLERAALRQQALIDAAKLPRSFFQWLTSS